MSSNWKGFAWRSASPSFVTSDHRSGDRSKPVPSCKATFQLLFQEDPKMRVCRSLNPGSWPTYNPSHHRRPFAWYLRSAPCRDAAEKVLVQGRSKNASFAPAVTTANMRVWHAFREVRGGVVLHNAMRSALFFFFTRSLLMAKKKPQKEKDKKSDGTKKLETCPGCGRELDPKAHFVPYNQGCPMCIAPPFSRGWICFIAEVSCFSFFIFKNLLTLSITLSWRQYFYHRLVLIQ